MKTLNEYISTLPKEEQDEIKTKAAKLTLESGLALLRQELNLSQKELAKTLGISQPAIAKLEQRGNDLKLVTLKRYIEGMGGTLKLKVTLPTGQEKIYPI
ncbi:MAG: XRE family transcriptional regulator [Pelistega sp.]|nr:XRE family transcriptional regulator [Pelistega sp.]